MSPNRPLFAGRSRADGVTRAQMRTDWTLLLRVSETAGALAGGGAELGADLTQELKHRVNRHAPQPFPLTHASAADAVGGFRAFARGFLAAPAGTPQAVAMGAALSAAARCLSRLLEIEEEAQAQAYARQTRARLGEREED